jgi:pimeloyl-ACP methyl ester carboxylesterase
MQSTFVLVHGAWYGGWCYARVAQRLTAAGHRVFTPTLTGLGERAHLYSRSIDLTTHITDIVNVIKWERLENFVLVGHSYGGMVVTGVADSMPEKIASLVYLDAFLPGDNQSLHDLLPPDAAQAQRDSATERNDFAVPPISAADFHVNEADRSWVDSLCTPQPLATLTQRLRLTGGLERISNRTYVLAMAGGAPFKRFRDSVATDPRWATHELPCGHDVMIDLPAETTALLTAKRSAPPPSA